MVDDWQEVPLDDWQDVPHEKDSSGMSVDAAARGFGDSALLGYGSHIRAATEPLVFKALNAVTGNDVPTDDFFDGDAYLRRRDSDIKETEQAKADHPKSYYSGFGGGMVASSLLPGASAAKGATALSRIGNTMKAGALMGAIANPGDTEGEFGGVQAWDRLKNAGLGMAIGGGLHAGGEGIAKAIEVAPNILKRFANEKGLKAVGAMKKDFKDLGEEGVEKLGQTLYDENILTPLARPKMILERLKGKAKGALDDVQGYISKADEVAGEMGIPGTSTAEIKDRAIREIRDSFPGVPEEELAPALQKVETWFSNRPENMSAQELQELKVGLNNFLNKSDFYKDMPGIGKEGLLAVRRGAKKAIEDKGNFAAEILGESAGKIKDTNAKLGKYLELQDMANDAIGRDAANRAISLTDTIAGAGGLTAGAVLGGPAALLTAGAAAGGNKLLRMYGNSVAGTTANTLANQLMKISPRFSEMAQKNPQAFALMAENLARSQKFTPKAPDAVPTEPQQNAPLLDRMSQDPGRMNYLKNDRLKEQLRKRMEDIKLKQKVPVEEAQASFIQNN